MYTCIFTTNPYSIVNRFRFRGARDGLPNIQRLLQQDRDRAHIKERGGVGIADRRGINDGWKGESGKSTNLHHLTSTPSPKPFL
jgi:hypothetical protein